MKLLTLVSALLQISELHNTPFSLILMALFSQLTLFSCFLSFLLIFCATVSLIILSSYIGSVGSTKSACLLIGVSLRFYWSRL